MSRQTTTSPPSRRRALLAAILLPVLLAAAGTVSWVPGGSHGFRRLRGAEAWTVLDPGLAFRVLLLHEFEVARDEIAVQDRVRVASREGAAAEVSYALSASLAGARRAEAAAEGMTPRDAAAHAVAEILTEESSALSGDDLLAGRSDAALRAALEEGLRRRGFEIRSLLASASASGRSDHAALAPAPRRTLKHPIVVLGWDGADWQIAEPLMRAGRMPALSALRERGAWGHLRSLPPMLSPLLWTTAATGKGPDQHGIVDFLVPDPATGRKTPISSAHRRVKALWNIFSDRRLGSSVVAWWATFPAEAVAGEIVSDRVAYSLFDVGRDDGPTGGLVFPPSLWPAVAARIVGPEQVPDADVQRLADVTAEDIARARETARPRGKAPGAPAAEPSRDRLVHLLKIVASATTYHGIALDAIGRGQPDLLAVYYQTIDEISHRFSHCATPALALCPPGDAKRYGRAVEAAYVRQDALLADLMSRIDPESFVILLSDHGFRNGGDRPRDETADIEGKPGKWHRLYGVAVVRGPGIQPGRLDEVTLLDIAPTVLRLAGLPAASDMPGRVLAEPSTVPAPPPAIATYEGAGPRSGVELASLRDEAGEEAMLENLRSLGYIGGAGENGSPQGVAAGARPAEAVAGTPGTLTAHTNVGAIHLQKGEFDRAAKEFAAALAIAPDYFPALMGMVEVKVHEGKIEEALGLARRAMEISPAPEPGVYLRYAGLSMRAGGAGEALAVLRRLRAERPRVAEIPTALAMLEQNAGRREEAERLLLEAVSLDPAGTEAMSRLFQMRRRAGTETSLEPMIRRALEMNRSSVLHRNWLGLILDRRGDAAGAEREFKEALATAPDFGGTMANLGSLYGRTGRLEEAVEILRRALRIEPDNLECRVNLGAALGKTGRTDEAIRILEGGDEFARKSPEILNALAVAYAQKGDRRRAADLLRRSLAVDPDQARARSMLEEIEDGS